MIAFIDEHREAYGVEPICRVLPIAPSTYYQHVAQRQDPSLLSERARRDQNLKPEIARIFAENFAVYGVRKVWRQMKREGFAVARCTVARLMQEMGLQGVIRGKPVRTTISDKAAPCPLDHVNRKFYAPAPNMLWVSDFTYVATWAGFVYVAFVIDTYARRIVGPAERRMPASSSMPWNKRFTIAGQPIGAASSITAIADPNTYPSSTPSALLKPGSNHPSAVSATPMTTLWPRRSTAFTRPRSSTDVGHGDPSRPSNMPRSSGWTGSTTAVCSNLSATSLPPKPRIDITPCSTTNAWQPNLTLGASDEPGAVHGCFQRRGIAVCTAADLYRWLADMRPISAVPTRSS
jgi:putative transposase